MNKYDQKEDRLNRRSDTDKAEPMDLQKRTELRVKALEGLVDNTGIIAFLRSPEEKGNVEFISRAIERFGYKAEDFTSGKLTFKDLIHPDDEERAYLELTENALEGANDFKQKYRIITKKGHIRLVEERTAIMRDEKGNVIYYQGVLEDITDEQ